MSLTTILSAIITHLQTILQRDKFTIDKIKQVTDHICRLQDFVNSMQRLELDDPEYAYLKAILLFSPENAPIGQLPAASKIEQFQDQAVKELKRYETTRRHEAIERERSDDHKKEESNATSPAGEESNTSSVKIKKEPDSDHENDTEKNKDGMENGSENKNEEKRSSAKKKFSKEEMLSGGYERFGKLVVSLLPLKSLSPQLTEELFFSGLVGSVRIHSIIPFILKMDSSELLAANEINSL